MPLSSLPNSGPTLFEGATKVSLKDVDVSQSTKNVDVTILEDDERMYAAPPLIDAAGAATATCSASGFLIDGAAEPEPTPISTTTGWVCEDVELSYEAGKHVTWSANYSYYPV